MASVRDTEAKSRPRKSSVPMAQRSEPMSGSESARHLPEATCKRQCWMHAANAAAIRFATGLVESIARGSHLIVEPWLGLIQRRARGLSTALAPGVSAVRLASTARRAVVADSS
jgi:hypothetical protein